MIRIGFIWITLVLFMAIPPSSALTHEKRLTRELMTKYEAEGHGGRPVHNDSDPVPVQFGMALVQILDLDERNQILTTSVWSRLLWTDVLLQWNPDDYGGIKDIRLPPGDIWTPDIVLFNVADSPEVPYTALTVVSHDGTVMWIPQTIYRSTCSVDPTMFPFDQQLCLLKFGSWTYDGWKLDLSFYGGLEEPDLTDYVRSNEWRIVKSVATRNVLYYPCCQEPYLDLSFYIGIERIAAMYTYILVIPAILLSVLTLVQFLLPPDSPDKVANGKLGDQNETYSLLCFLLCASGLAIFVSFFVLLMIVSDILPPAASSIPLLGAYFTIVMILITLSSFLAVMVAKVCDIETPPPRCVHVVFVRFLASLLLVRLPRRKKKLDRNSYAMTETAHSEENHAREPSLPHDKVSRDHKRDWYIVASVCDRIFLILYLVAIVVALVYILPTRHRD